MISVYQKIFVNYTVRGGEKATKIMTECCSIFPVCLCDIIKADYHCFWSRQQLQLGAKLTKRGFPSLLHHWNTLLLLAAWKKRCMFLTQSIPKRKRKKKIREKVSCRIGLIFFLRFVKTSMNLQYKVCVDTFDKSIEIFFL